MVRGAFYNQHEVPIFSPIIVLRRSYVTKSFIVKSSSESSHTHTHIVDSPFCLCYGVKVLLANFRLLAKIDVCGTAFLSDERCFLIFLCTI